MINRQTLKPGKHFIIDYPPLNDEIDIHNRIELGVSIAVNEGFKYAFIIEDDDYYPDSYFHSMMDTFNHGYDITGIYKTLVYNLCVKHFQVFRHNNYSSFFCTAFKLPLPQKWDWPVTLYLDKPLWKFAWSDMKPKLTKIIPMPVNIKHNIGKRAGLYHFDTKSLSLPDTGLNLLKSIIDTKSFQFYKSIADA
jgi:hypothetical protein